MVPFCMKLVELYLKLQLKAKRLNLSSFKIVVEVLLFKKKVKLKFTNATCLKSS